jgi:glycosyltransferase involved in cell wall biosynthesis
MSAPLKNTQNTLPGYLLVIPWEIHHIGGVNQVVANLYDEMEMDGGFKPYLLISDWECPTPKLTLEANRNVVRARIRPPFDSKNPFKSIGAFFLHHKQEVKDLAAFINQSDIKIINIHYPTLESLVFFEMRRAGLIDVKIVISLHGLDIRSAATQKGLAAHYWRKIWDGANHIVTCSDGLAKDVALYDEQLMTKTSTVYNGIDIARLKIQKQENVNIPNALVGREYLLNIGTYEHKKGHDVLLPAFQEVVEKYPEMMLVTIGRAGETSDQTRDLIEQLDLTDNVVMLENVQHGEVLNYLENAKIFVLPSRNEGFAVVLLEAGAFGLPVIATDVCGVAELIESGKSGILVENEDWQGLSKAIITLVADDSSRTSMATTLHQEVQQDYTWRKTFEGYQKLTEQLLN